MEKQQAVSVFFQRMEEVGKIKDPLETMKAFINLEKYLLDMYEDAYLKGFNNGVKIGEEAGKQAWIKQNSN